MRIIIATFNFSLLILTGQIAIVITSSVFYAEVFTQVKPLTNY